jgi:mono/diheme cytochrome c family protein
MIRTRITPVRLRRCAVVSLLAWLFSSASTSLAQKVPDTPSAPLPTALVPPIDLNDPANIEAGREMFNVTCTHYCHGRDARGGGMRGPSLRNGNFDNAYLFGRITGGKPPMPAFGSTYTTEQIWKIIAYVKSLKD